MLNQILTYRVFLGEMISIIKNLLSSQVMFTRKSSPLRSQRKMRSFEAIFLV